MIQYTLFLFVILLIFIYIYIVIIPTVFGNVVLTQEEFTNSKLTISSLVKETYIGENPTDKGYQDAVADINSRVTLRIDMELPDSVIRKLEGIEKFIISFGGQEQTISVDKILDDNNVLTGELEGFGNTDLTAEGNNILTIKYNEPGQSTKVWAELLIGTEELKNLLTKGETFVSDSETYYITSGSLEPLEITRQYYKFTFSPNTDSVLNYFIKATSPPETENETVFKIFQDGILPKYKNELTDPNLLLNLVASNRINDNDELRMLLKKHNKNEFFNFEYGYFEKLPETNDYTNFIVDITETELTDEEFNKALFLQRVSESEVSTQETNLNKYKEYVQSVVDTLNAKRHAEELFDIIDVNVLINIPTHIRYKAETNLENIDEFLATHLGLEYPSDIIPDDGTTYSVTLGDIESIPVAFFEFMYTYDYDIENIVTVLDNLQSWFIDDFKQSFIDFSDSVKSKACLSQFGDCSNSILTSPDGRYTARMYGHGIIILIDLRETGIRKFLWTSNKYSQSNFDGKTAPYTLNMQPDGNLVIRDSAGRSVWESVQDMGNTSAPGRDGGPYKLIMRNGGNLGIYDRLGQPVWSSDQSNAYHQRIQEEKEERERIDYINSLNCSDYTNYAFPLSPSLSPDVYDFHEYMREEGVARWWCDANNAQDERCQYVRWKCPVRDFSPPSPPSGPTTWDDIVSTFEPPKDWNPFD